MLTPANTFMLGLIANAPCNPYDIVARFEYNKLLYILSIPESTIYGNIRTMCKKGYIQYETRQDGNMPAKKMYTITESGFEELKASVAHYLSSYSYDWGGFSVSLLLMHHFTKEELLQFLNKRKDSILELLKERECAYRFVEAMQSKGSCIPNLACSFHVASVVREELNVVNAVISMVERVSDWPQNVFDYDDMYKDVAAHFVWEKEMMSTNPNQD